MKLYATHQWRLDYNSLEYQRGRSFRAVSISKLADKSFNGGNLLTCKVEHYLNQSAIKTQKYLKEIPT